MHFSPKKLRTAKILHASLARGLATNYMSGGMYGYEREGISRHVICREPASQART